MPDRINLTVSESGPIRLDAMDQNAYMATMLENPRDIDGISFDGTADVMRYATCSTAAGTAAKTATVTGFSLVAGSMVVVRFTRTNTAATPTLNVSSTGARGIRYMGAALPTPNVISAGTTYLLVFDGTYWEIVGNYSDGSDDVHREDVVVVTNAQVDAMF